jgi:hypothetical protein
MPRITRNGGAFLFPRVLFVIYADHDEYATFYANTRSNLNRVADALFANGLKRYRYAKGEDSDSWRTISITLIVRLMSDRLVA